MEAQLDDRGNGLYNYSIPPLNNNNNMNKEQKEELKKEQILRLAKFIVSEYQYQLFPEIEPRTGFKKLDEPRQKAFLEVAKCIIEDFEF